MQKYHAVSDQEISDGLGAGLAMANFGDERVWKHLQLNASKVLESDLGILGKNCVRRLTGYGNTDVWEHQCPGPMDNFDILKEAAEAKHST
eukprot:5299637-Amphidinium_carterae.1